MVLRGTPPQLSYPYGTSAAALRGEASSFCVSAFPTSLNMASFVILGYKTSLQPVFSCLVTMRVL